MQGKILKREKLHENGDDLHKNKEAILEILIKTMKIPNYLLTTSTTEHAKKSKRNWPQKRASIFKETLLLWQSE